MKIEYIKNPFTKERRFTSFEVENVKDISNFIDFDYKIILNKQIVRNDLDYKLSEDDKIIVIPEVLGSSDDGKLILNLVMMVALMQFAPGFAKAITGATEGFFYSFAQVGFIAAGGLLISSLTPAPDTETLDYGSYQTYSFTPKTVSAQGITIPKIYGENLVKGNLIAQKLYNDNNEQYLSLLFALCDGPINGISQTGTTPRIYLNSQRYDSYPGVSIYSRKGEVDQDPIDFFKDIQTTTSLNYLLDEDVPQSRLAIGPADDYKVVITFPNGLYGIDQKTGKRESRTVSFKVEAKRNDSSTWTTLEESKSISANSSSEQFLELYLSDYEDLLYINPDFSYDVRITRITSASGSYNIWTSYWKNFSTIINQTFIYPFTSLVAIKAVANEYLSGNIDFSAIVEGKIIRYYDADSESWEIGYNNNPAYVILDILTQPVIVGDETSGYSIDDYEGLDISNINLEDFIELGIYCDEYVDINSDVPEEGQEKRHICNVVFDNKESVWDQALTICKQCQSTLVFKANKIGLVIDKGATPVYLFNNDNIIENSLEISYIPRADRVSELALSYRDEDNSYQRSVFNLFDTDIETGNKQNINLRTVTRESEAYRIGYRALLKNKLLEKTINFESADGFHLDIGDLFLLSSTIPTYTATGRILRVDWSANSIEVNEEINPEDSSGDFICFLKDNQTDELYEFNVLEYYETDTNTYLIFLDNDFSDYIPKAGDLYSFGYESEIKETYKINSISTNSDYNTEISAIQYIEDIYTDDFSSEFLSQVSSDFYSVDDLRVLEPGTETIGFDLSTYAEITDKKQLQKKVYVGWKVPDDVPWASADVYIKYSSDTKYTFYKNTQENNLIIDGLARETTYDVLVISVDKYGQKTSFLNSPTKSITTSGSDLSGDGITFSPIDLQTVDGQVNPAEFYNDVNLVWDIPATATQLPADFVDYYEIEVYHESIKVRTDTTSTKSYTYSMEMNAIDSSGEPSRELYFFVKCVDMYGRKSVAPGIIRCDNTAPAAVSTINTYKSFGSIYIKWDAVEERDVKGYIIYSSDKSSDLHISNIDSSFIIYNGQDTVYQYRSDDPSKTVYFRIGVYDSFYPYDITFSTIFAEELENIRDLSINAPLLSEIIFENETGTSNVQWSAGNVLFGETEYSVTSGSTGSKYIIWDESSPTVFTGTNLETDFINSSTIWCVCINIAGDPNPQFGQRLITSGLIQAGAITSGKIATDSITADMYQELRQTLPFTGGDSLDNNFPYEIPILVPTETTDIISLKVSFSISDFRAYSKNLESDPADTVASSGPADWSMFAETESTDLGMHNHGGGSHSHDLSGSTTSEDGNGYHSHGFSYSAGTDSSGNIVDTVNLGSHTHNLTDKNSNHKHNVTVPEHNHNINFGIYEKNTSPTIGIYVDNGSGYGSLISSYTSDQVDLDLTLQISGTGWKKIKFTSSDLTRLSVIAMLKVDITA